MPKATAPPHAAARRHNPLEDDIVATGHLRTHPKSKRKSRHSDKEDGEDGEDKFVDAKASRRILRIGQELADEDEEEREAAGGGKKARVGSSAFDFESRFEGEGIDEDEDGEGQVQFGDEDDGWGDEEETEVVEVDDLAPGDLATFQKFFPAGEVPSLGRLNRGWGDEGEEEEDEDIGEQGGGTNLADLILEKIAQLEAAQNKANGVNQDLGGVGPVDEDYELAPKVVEVYSKIGLILSRYKSGKLPKAFKILPTVPRWEDILEVTQPLKWTTNAVYEATKIFISNTPVVAQRFLEMVVLDRVRENIYETKKLDVHLFNALKKGLYKPAAWFKGFLFPLVSSGTCTLREAHIISAVLTRTSVPVLHSAAAIKGLCDISAQSFRQSENGNATNIFIQCLLAKKYSLPYQVIDALVFHFLKYRNMDTDMSGTRKEDEKLPVIWHQCLLTFAQRYRNDITEDQREALLDLILTKGHPAIGPEIRRELLAGRGRGVPVPVEGPVGDGDDTMMVD